MSDLTTALSTIDLPLLEPVRQVDNITVRELFPTPSLREFVRSYNYTEMCLGAGSLVKPVTARPELMMQFSLRRPFAVIDRMSGVRYEAPDVVVVGRQTRRNVDLIATGDLVTLTVHFQPNLKPVCLRPRPIGTPAAGRLRQ